MQIKTIERHVRWKCKLDIGTSVMRYYHDKWSVGGPDGWKKIKNKELMLELEKMYQVYRAKEVQGVLKPAMVIPVDSIPDIMTAQRIYGNNMYGHNIELMYDEILADARKENSQTFLEKWEESLLGKNGISILVFHPEGI